MKFYSYIYLRGDNTPYYAGKGTGDRAFLQRNHNVKVPPRGFIVVFSMDSEELALESEKALIELFGRKNNGTGILRNLTDGGDGVSGLRHSEETKKIIRAKRALQTITQESKQKRSEANKRLGIVPPNSKGIKRSATWHEKQSKRDRSYASKFLNRKGTKCSEKSKAKMREAALNRSDEVKLAQTERLVRARAIRKDKLCA